MTSVDPDWLEVVMLEVEDEADEGNVGYISAETRPEAVKSVVDVVCSNFADTEPEIVLRRDV